jgi:hypothetical protein
MRKLIFVVGLMLVSGSLSARDINWQNYLIGERAAGMGGAQEFTGDAKSAEKTRPCRPATAILGA